MARLSVASEAIQEALVALRSREFYFQELASFSQRFLDLSPIEKDFVESRLMRVRDSITYFESLNAASTAISQTYTRSDDGGPDGQV